MKIQMLKSIAWAFLLIGFAAGCASFRPAADRTGEPSVRKSYGHGQADVLFVFNHTKQLKGIDTIPKLTQAGANDFDDLFKDALKELGNISNYITFTEMAHDVESPKRRQEKQDLIKSSDFVVEINIHKRASFARNFLGGLLTSATLTLVPVSYPRDYTATVNVYDSRGELLKSYQQKEKTGKWIQLFLVFLYPTHNPDRVTEEIYLDILHKIFRQIEADQLLSLPAE